MAYNTGRSETVREKKPPFMTHENMKADAKWFRRHRGGGDGDVVCWIPTSAVQYIDFWFWWDGPCFEKRWALNSIRQTDVDTLMIRTQSRVRVRVGPTKSVPLPWTEVSLQGPSIEVANTKNIWTFFRDQIFSPLNGGVPWIEVSQRRGSTVPSLEHWTPFNCYICLFKFE